MTDCEKGEQFVCISCVEEVRYSFVSHLSEALRRKGIDDVIVDVVDSDDLFSKESQSKVEKAKVSLLVLPGNSEPTTTTICRDKFVKVLECRRHSDQVVVPVLYGDIPLRGEWLTALGLTGLSPLHQSREEFDDSVLVEEIVRDVYEKLFHMGRIGIYSKLLEIEKMVSKQPLGTRLVGVWGMPGIGKTTLAKAVFHQMCTYFDASCFIEDCEKAIHDKGLYRLLEERLLKEHPGTITKPSLLSDKLSSERILVVLDDVGDPRVAESFLDGFEFGPESLIIITSRDKQVFRLCRINHLYEVQGLNEKEALQLFCLGASVKDITEQNVNELAMKVVLYANGNPLALSVFARELKGNTNPSAFLKLKQCPPFEMVDAFKSSYDTLSDSEKSIFLDIACFFQGENVDYLMQLLDGCGFFPHVGIDVLVDKCLVTVSENRVWMHNLTQDVGREFVVGETVHIERRSRLWEPDSIKYLLEECEHEVIGEAKTSFKRAQGTEVIEGMFLDTSYLNLDIKPAAFVNMLNLRLLKIYCSNPEIRPAIKFSKGFLHSLPNALRLLHWENYPLESLPQNFDPRHLVEINMPYSQLQKLWGGTKNLEMLRTVRLCNSHQLIDIDDLLKAKNIEVIDLQGCTRLQSFPATGQLIDLRVVNLSGCTEIKSLQVVPPNIETLNLQGTGITELPLSIDKPNGGELKSLLAEIDSLSDALKLERLESLKKSSSSCQDPRKLICLELRDCFRLRSLPNMGNLQLLAVLNLSGCSKLETIQGFPRNLKELYLTGTAVRKVPQLPQSLELLNAHGCVSLKKIALDSEKRPVRYTFTNCFNLSPQVVSDFLVKVLGNVKHIPSELPLELNEAPAFSFCAPSHVNQDSTLDLQPGSFVMRRLNPSWKNTVLGFAMLVEVAFSEDYSDANGFGINCVCRWKNKEGHSYRIERNLHCWVEGKAAPKVRKNHIFTFCDVNMRLSTDKGNDPDIWADLVVFEFFPVNQHTKSLDDSCTVLRCGVYAITSNTDVKMSSPVFSLDSVKVSGNEVEDVLIVSYDGLKEMDKALLLYVACLFDDEDSDLVAPLIATIDVDISSGIKELASRSLIHVSGNGEIVMHCLIQRMCKEILHNQSMLPDSPKELARVSKRNSIGSSWSHNRKRDLYPSFSRQDVSKSFISQLLVAIKLKSVITCENNEMDRGQLCGPLLVQAIRDSRISIVVFSKRYASSSWLLNELVEIAKCRQELGQTAIPFFFDVDPSEVRRQTGDFGRHFKQICKGKTEDEKQQWQRALVYIANLPGYNNLRCLDEINAHNAKKNPLLWLESEEVNCVPSACFRDLVGITSHIAKMIPLLRLESEEVKMVRIWGPPGIGKTTIARYLYNQIASNFQCCAFVDILKGYSKRGRHTDEYSVKLHYQQLVLSEIMNEEGARASHLGVMQERLRDQKVLLILDGVDDLLLLDAVARNSNWFGPRSRIIVITENLALLKSQGINCIYKVELPSKKEALQMLCQSAFLQNSPPDGFMQLATEVAELAGYLPLGLRVLVSYLREMDKEVWLTVWPQLKIRLVGGTESILELSYDVLSDELKDLFLYISCIFSHATVDYITRLLTSRFMDIKRRLKIFAEKSLIHISEYGNVTMHHLLQQLGREIVRKECVHEPGERRFLVDYLDICEVLTKNTGTRRVIGIVLDMSEIKELLISEKGFNEMTNLQFLKFYTNSGDKEVKVHIPDGLDYLSDQLVILHWEGFPMRCMPSYFIPINLVELTMIDSKLVVLWRGVQPLGNLKCMNLRGSFDLREIPDLTRATNLETLDLGGCSSLTELPSSIQNLHKLKDLDMERCIHLEALPTDINLDSLYYLNLNGCSRLRSFPQISRSILDLYLDGTAIEEVPDWVENMSGLSYLSMNGCNKLKKISSNISKLKLLVEVDFSQCEALTEESWQNHPEEVCTSLMRVNMSGNSFERLPDTWTSIQPKDLDIGSCRNLASLPNLPASVCNLTANHCGSLETLYGPFQQRQMALQFMNCFKLNHQAREFILRSDCAYAILPGEELPAYFSHRVVGNLIARITLSRRISSFKACIMVESRVCWFDFGVNCSFIGSTDTKYFSLMTSIYSKTNHLIIFGFELPWDGFSAHVQFDFFCHDQKKNTIKIKECGVQLLEVSPSLIDEVSPSLIDSRKRFKTEDDVESGVTDAEASRSSKQMRGSMMRGARQRDTRENN